jgi:hypothetical protein
MLDRNIPTNINPLYVRAAAAEAFWRYARKFGRQRAMVAASVRASELWSEAQAQAYLARRMLKTTPDEATAFCLAVHADIRAHLKRNEPIEGVLLAKDFETCRAPEEKLDSLLSDLAGDADAGDALCIGHLLLRTPLPAGVLLSREAESGQRIVPDTTRALGFRKELALQVRAVRAAPRNDCGYTHYASGTFLIRSTAVLAPKWLSLIPNANVIAREQSLAA